MSSRRRHTMLGVALLGLALGPLAFALAIPETGRPGRAEHPRLLVPKALDYSTSVHPIWNAQGCTSCHVGGILDLDGSPSAVYPEVRDHSNTSNPGASLILTKPQPGGSHGGGDFGCFNPGNSCYDTIFDWISEGAHFTPCSFSINPSSRNHGSAGGTGSVAVTAGSGCDWTATESLSWVSVTAGASGSGNGNVSYSVSANPSTSSRSGTITIAGKTFTVSQNGVAPCTFSINPTSRNHGAAAGTGTVAVSAGTGCGWTATESLPWVDVTAGAAGSGNGTVSYSVSANTTQSLRSGTMTIAGKTFTITQDAAAACTISIDPLGRNHGAAAGTGTVAVSAGPGCAWTVSESLSWLSVTAGAAGSGDGSVDYAVAANTDTTSRSGTVDIGGTTFTVSQDAAAGGACVQDATTACLLNGRFRAVVRYRGVFDNAPADTSAFRKPVTGFANPNFETAFFYFNSTDNIEILLKMLDQGNTNSAGQPTIAVLFGSATPLRVELTITDTTNGSVRTYFSAFGSQAGATDFTAFVR